MSPAGEDNSPLRRHDIRAAGLLNVNGIAIFGEGEISAIYQCFHGQKVWSATQLPVVGLRTGDETTA